MKNLLSTLALPGLALGAATLLLAPVPESYGFSLIGGSLSAEGQRDWRVFNDFADATANNNQTADPAFPGWQGADMALWKAASEWASVPHGDGSGDSSQPNIGDGGANFDFYFAGSATAGGGINHNIVSTISSCGGGTLAYVLSPISNGWRMKFCENWTWDDGPGSVGGRIDIQGVGTHEFGHSLGLGHSATGAATMFGSTSNGFSQRSIHPDDQAGVQFIYGAASASKPLITGTVVDLEADTIEINGSNFSATNNEVWFTRATATATNADPRLRVTGVSSSGGGTSLTVVIPGGAANGDVHVKANFTGNSSLSNGWPVDLAVGGSSDPLTITSVSPTVVESLDPGTAETFQINGTGFSESVVVNIGITPVDPSRYTVVSDELITVNLPLSTSSVGLNTLFLQEGAEIALDNFTVVAPTTPVLECGNGDPLNTVSGNFDVTYAGPVGQTHYALYSSFNIPSAVPIVSLDIGNFFTDLQVLDAQVIGATGWAQANYPLPAITTDIYLQSITLQQGTPIPVSNLQSIHVIP